MKPIMVIGVGPMPAPHLSKVHAPGLRLKWTLEALSEQKDIGVHLGEFAFGGDKTRSTLPVNTVYSHRLLGPTPERAAEELDRWIQQVTPAGIIALTDVGALAVAKTSYAGPLYVDYFGHPMAERQQQAYVHENNESLADQWLYVLPALLRADRFSVCSKYQRLALIGELGATGRLNQETCGHTLVDIVPLCLPSSEPYQLTDRTILQKWNIPNNARTIFSSGGFNTWFDELTLFKALEAAMGQEPSLHFIATGGPIPGHVELTYNKFRKRVDQSKFRDRFHFPGWVRHEDYENAMLSCDVAVNVDLPTLEGELGTRNRLLGWAWAGMRIVSTVIGNPARRLAGLGLLTPVDFGDWKSLAQALCEEANRGRHNDLQPIHDQLLKEWSLDKNYAPIVKWALDPKRAADRENDDMVDNPLANIQRRFMQTADQSLVEFSIRRKARELGERLAGSRLAKLAASMSPETRKLIDELRNL